MSLPRGWSSSGSFVCVDCATKDDRKGLRCDDRVASGLTCERCGTTMPYEATVRLLPDGWRNISAPVGFRPELKSILLERRESVLIDGSVLVFVDVGCQREVGLRVTPTGSVEVWVHDDPYGDGDEPSARWDYDPSRVQNGHSTPESE